MNEAQSKEAWQHTSSIIASIYNCRPFRPKNDKDVKPKDVNPHYKDAKSEPIPADITALKALLPPEKRKCLPKKPSTPSEA